MQNFEEITEGEVIAPAEYDEENLTLSSSHGRNIELGLGGQEVGIDALLSHSTTIGKSNQSARTFICLSDGTSVTRYVREASSILNNEMCLETGFGPKQESIRFMKRNISRSKIPQYITPRVQIEITGIRTTRWRLASAVLRENQHIWGQYATPYERIPEVEASCPICEFKARDLNTNFVDPQIKNWPGDDLLGRGDKLLRSLLLSFATAAYGGIHTSAWNQYFVTASECHWGRFCSIFIAASGVVMNLRTIGSQAVDRMMNIERYWPWVLVYLFIGMPLAYSAITAGSIYFIARCYLVVEALIGLHQLPVDAYQTPRSLSKAPITKRVSGLPSPNPFTVPFLQHNNQRGPFNKHICTRLRDGFASQNGNSRHYMRSIYTRYRF